jgi:hypothetical protein
LEWVLLYLLAVARTALRGEIIMRKAIRVAYALSSIGAIVILLLVGCGGADQAVTTKASLRTGTTEASLIWRGSSDEPLPIPGGTVFGPGLPLMHVFSPGPILAGYDGINVDPSTITNFKGLSMIAEDYTLTATAAGSDGTKYLLGTDMRVFRGKYRTSSGDHNATFCFI